MPSAGALLIGFRESLPLRVSCGGLKISRRPNGCGCTLVRRRFDGLQNVAGSMIIHAAAQCAFFFSLFFESAFAAQLINRSIYNRYSHGFLFPSEASRAQEGVKAFFDRQPEPSHLPTASAQNWYDKDWGAPAEWARSSVSTFGTRYTLPLPNLTIPQSIEALVEGSDMSRLYEGT